MREEQSIFLRNVAKLIIWAFDNDYELTLGEGYRTIDQQRLHYYGYDIDETNGNLFFVKRPRSSKTMKSKHLNRLAIDLNLFINGKYITDKEKFAPLAEYWRSLHPNNESGYDWGYDANHFEMKL